MTAARELMTAWQCGCRHRELARERPGHCGKCGAFNSFRAAEQPAERAPLRMVRTPAWTWGNEVNAEQVERARSNWRPWRHVTGELPRRHLALFGGRRGLGKTTMLLHVAGGVVRELARPVLYVLADGQGPGAVKALATSLVGLDDELASIAFLHRPDLETMAVAARELRPAMIVLDAFKRTTVGGMPCKPNTQAERAGTELACSIADECDAAVVATLHMRSCGRKYSVGSAPLQACDLIVRVDRVPEPVNAIRFSCDGKNRYWPDDREAFLRRDEHGSLVEVSP